MSNSTSREGDTQAQNAFEGGTNHNPMSTKSSFLSVSPESKLEPMPRHSQRQLIILRLRSRFRQRFALCRLVGWAHQALAVGHDHGPTATAMDVQRAEQSTSTVASTSSPIKSIIATSDGGGLVSSHQDGKIRVWHAARPWGNRSGDGEHHLALRLRAVLPTAADRLRAFVSSPSNYAEARRHRHRRRQRTWVHHDDAVTALALSPDGAEMYSVSWDRSLKAWRLRPPSLRCVESVAAAHGDAINAVAVSADGHVYTGSADRTVRAWRRRPETGKLTLVATMERHEAAVNALALGAGGRVLYSGACDKTVVVWERAAGAGERSEATAAATATATLRGHTGAVLCLAAAGRVVCSGSADRTVRVWRREATAASYTCLAVLQGHAAAVKSLALVNNKLGGDHGGSCNESCCCGCRCAAFVCSGSLDCDVKIWRVVVSCV